MGVTRYNKIYNFSLAVIVLYNVLCLVGLVASLPIITSIISKSAIIYVLYSVGMLCYKIHLTRKYFLGNYALFNMIAHGVLTGLSIFLILVVLL